MVCAYTPTILYVQVSEQCDGGVSNPHLHLVAWAVLCWAVYVLRLKFACAALHCTLTLFLVSVGVQGSDLLARQHCSPAVVT